MNMRTPFIYRIIVFLVVSIFCYLQGFAQDEIFTDSLSHNVMENIYKEEPKTVSNDSSNSKKRTSFNGYPYVFYTPESKFAAGAGGIFIFYGGREKDLKPSKIGFGGYYSTNKQYKISISPNLYFLDNKLYIELPTSYGYFINKYWGIGDDTPVYDKTNNGIKEKKFEDFKL